MLNWIFRKRYLLVLLFFMAAYVWYFSSFTILRYKTLYASYFDLGIMHQTVFNTYKAISTGDLSRFLELTNPLNSEQIKRMAIHNDPLLALFAPFYFIFSGPETLLVLQSIILSLGAIAVFKISQEVFKANKYRDLISLIFASGYLLYYPLQLANIFEFHAVTFATSGLLFMFYFWLVKKYWWSFIFFILCLLSKEQVALTTMMFGIYSIIFCHCEQFKTAKQSHFSIKGLLRRFTPRNDTDWYYSLAIILISIFWFAVSVFYIIPLFRGGDHFATERYSELGDSPIKIILNLVLNPLTLAKYIFRKESWDYFVNLLGPVGFLSVLSPLQFLISLPELAINLLSQNGRMRYMIYHYTAVLTPFVFISAIYGANKLINFKYQISNFKTTDQKSKITILLLLFVTVYYAYFKGPLPFAKTKNIHPYKYVAKEVTDVALWGRILKDENLKISSVGQLSPFFTSRRYFYTFSDRYKLADYVIIRLNEIYQYPEKDELIPVYEDLIEDPNFRLIYQKTNFEVYKKISNSNNKQ